MDGIIHHINYQQTIQTPICLSAEPLGCQPFIRALRHGQLAELVEPRQDDLLSAGYGGRLGM